MPADQQPSYVESDEYLMGLYSDIWEVNSHSNGLPSSYTASQMYDLNIQDQRHHLTTAGMYSDLGTDISFKGRVGRGLISIEDIMKSEDASGPFISEISKAAYEDHFPLHTLRYIFVTNRGTQKISRVALWKTGQYANFIQARFDIEKVYVKSSEYGDIADI
ncbi:hypothetical protein N7533_012974 [Penicillium manginii]|uniref:uncharacterized protein n=1 Tax=Penicillium manginii TaxID=203109 RepID=UPI00254922A6|nr:uncharacterized protein N7533_012974 [Penicillium manginii]KAJ5734571.1 hypothetical protein N7533_012974 [Penicillium manginii]